MVAQHRVKARRSWIQISLQGLYALIVFFFSSVRFTGDCYWTLAVSVCIHVFFFFCVMCLCQIPVQTVPRLSLTACWRQSSVRKQRDVLSLYPLVSVGVLTLENVLKLICKLLQTKKEIQTNFETLREYLLTAHLKPIKIWSQSSSSWPPVLISFSQQILAMTQLI